MTRQQSRENEDSVLARSALGYLGIAAIGYASFQLDTLVIATQMSTGEVTRYSVGAKYLLIVPITLAFFLQPLWAKYSHLLAIGQLTKIRASFLRSAWATLGVSAMAVTVLVVGSSKAFELWSIEPAARPSLGLLLALGSLVLANAVVGPQAMLLNGVGAMRFQVVTGTMMAVSNVFLSLLLVQHIGASGPVLGSTISLVLLIALPNAWYLKYRLFSNGEIRDATE